MKKIIRGIYEWSKMILFALIVAFWLKDNVVASNPLVLYTAQNPHKIYFLYNLVFLYHQCIFYYQFLQSPLLEDL